MHSHTVALAGTLVAHLGMLEASLCAIGVGRLGRRVGETWRRCGLRQMAVAEKVVAHPTFSPKEIILLFSLSLTHPRGLEKYYLIFFI